jgi:hypothetical protein
VLEFASFTIILEAPTHEAAVEWQHALDVLLDQVVPAVRTACSSLPPPTSAAHDAAAEQSRSERGSYVGSTAVGKVSDRGA